MACLSCGGEIERVVGESPTRFYCSELCAYRGMMRRRGERSPLLAQLAQEAAEKKEERAQRPRPAPPARREPTQDEKDHSDLRYGPERRVVEVLETYGTGNHRAKVKMECGHVRAWIAGQETARCMKCRPTPISGGSGGARRPAAESQVVF